MRRAAGSGSRGVVASPTGGQGVGVNFLAGALIIADMVAKACSSPQTTEINAGARAPTLMKWVMLGLAEGVGFVALAAYMDKEYRVPILFGGALEVVITASQYIHAKNAGLANPGPPTESYG